MAGTEVCFDIYLISAQHIYTNWSCALQADVPISWEVNKRCLEWHASLVRAAESWAETRVETEGRPPPSPAVLTGF